MDRHTIVLFIPILALSIPVLAIALHGLQKYWQMRIEEARIRSGQIGASGEAELGELRADLDQVRQELAEVQERLDFTERMLAKSNDRDRLPGPPLSP